ncbi:MAG: leucine-rich repeat domain-containing protein [Lachnospiraceae bacterium]|nr:leucine-rich repeat domain-containing protein [Lachnospiraceae bacterium]
MRKHIKKEIKKIVSLTTAFAVLFSAVSFAGADSKKVKKASATVLNSVVSKTASESAVATDSSASTVTTDKAVKVGDKVKVKKVTYKITAKKKATFFKSSDKKAKTVKVPKTVKIKGKTYKVTAIGKKACKGFKKLKTLKIGKNVTSIGDESFSGCKKLNNVEIPKNVKSIGKKAFYNCKGLEYMNFKTKKLTKKKVGKKAFKGTNRYIVVKVPSSKRYSYEDIFVSKGMSFFLYVKI